jgi:hypothetical protein
MIPEETSLNIYYQNPQEQEFSVNGVGSGTFSQNSFVNKNDPQTISVPTSLL